MITFKTSICRCKEENEVEYEITVKIGYEAAEPSIGYGESLWIDEVLDENDNHFEITREEDNEIL